MSEPRADPPSRGGAPNPQVRETGVRWRRWRSGAVLGASLGFVGWILATSPGIWGSLEGVRLKMAFVLVMVQGVNLVVQSGRYHSILRFLSRREVPFDQWLRVFVVARFINFWIPQGGNVFRALAVKAQFQIGLAAYGAALSLAAWASLLINLALATLLLAILEPAMRLFGVLLLPALVGVLAVVGFGPLVVRSLLPLRVSFGPMRGIGDRVHAFLDLIMDGIVERRHLFAMMSWGSAAAGTGVLVLWCGFVALGLNAGVADVVAFFVVRQLTSHFSVTPGNLGVNEALFGLVGSATDIGAAEGVFVSALLRVTGVCATAVVAVPYGGVAAARQWRRTGAAAD